MRRGVGKVWGIEVHGKREGKVGGNGGRRGIRAGGVRRRTVTGGGSEGEGGKEDGKVSKRGRGAA